MAATLTKVAGPHIKSGIGVEYVFSLLLDTSHAAGGEPIDLTDYLSTLTEGNCSSVDSAADALYTYTVAGPGVGTTLTSSNVLIVAAQSDTLEGALDEANAIDLSGVGELMLTVVGKGAIQASWA